MKTRMLLILGLIIGAAYFVQNIFDYEPKAPAKGTTGLLDPMSNDVDVLRNALSQDWKSQKNSIVQIAKRNTQSPGQIIASNPKKDLKAKNNKKKNKKTAKKSAKKKFVAQKANNNQNYNETSGNNFSPPDSNGLYPSPINASNESDTKTPDTVEEWMRKLINPINKEALDNFILSFQSGLIDAELYYSVIDALLNYGSNDVAELALIALSSTPSQMSFEKMIMFINKGGSIPAVQTAKNLVLSYKKLELIGILNQQLFSEDDSVQFQAAVLIRDSANDFLKLKSKDVKEIPGEPTAPPARSISSPEFQVYLQSYNLMKSLLSNGQAQNSASVIQEAIQILEKILKA